MQSIVNRTKLSLIQGDITRQATEAIVNAANPSLMGGGGVDGAIHRAGGPAILEECQKIRAEKGLKSISFPSISTCAYGYPVEEAARVALKTVTGFLQTNTALSEVDFVLFDHYTYDTYRQAFPELLPDSLPQGEGELSPDSLSLDGRGSG